MVETIPRLSPCCSTSSSSVPSTSAASFAAPINALLDPILVRIFNMLNKRDQMAVAGTCRRWHALILTCVTPFPKSLWDMSYQRQLCLEGMSAASPVTVRDSCQGFKNSFANPREMADWFLQEAVDPIKLPRVGRLLFRLTPDHERNQVAEHILRCCANERNAVWRQHRPITGLLAGYLPPPEYGAFMTAMLKTRKSTDARLDLLCVIQNQTADFPLSVQLMLWQTITPQVKDQELRFLLKRDIRIVPFAVGEEHWRRVVLPALTSVHRCWSDDAICHYPTFSAHMKEIVARQASRCAALPATLRSRHLMTEISVLLEELHTQKPAEAEDLWRLFCSSVKSEHLINLLTKPGRTNLRKYPRLPLWQLYTTFNFLDLSEIRHCLKAVPLLMGELLACSAAQLSRKDYAQVIDEVEIPLFNYAIAVRLCALHCSLSSGLEVLLNFTSTEHIPHLLMIIKSVELQAALRLTKAVCEHKSSSFWDAVVRHAHNDLWCSSHLVSFLCSAMLFTKHRERAIENLVCLLSSVNDVDHVLQQLQWAAYFSEEEAENALKELLKRTSPNQHFLTSCFREMDPWISRTILSYTKMDQFVRTARCFNYAYLFPAITSQNIRCVMYQNDLKLLHVVNELCADRLWILMAEMELSSIECRRILSHIIFEAGLTAGRYPTEELTKKLRAMFFSDPKWRSQDLTRIVELLRWVALHDLSSAQSAAKRYLAQRSAVEEDIPDTLKLLTDPSFASKTLEAIDTHSHEKLSELLPFLARQLPVEAVLHLAEKHSLGLWSNGLLGYLDENQLIGLDQLALNSMSSSVSPHIRTYLLRRKQCQRDLSRPTNPLFEEAWRRLYAPPAPRSSKSSNSQAVCYQDELPPNLLGTDVADLAYLRGSQGRIRLQVLREVLKTLKLDDDVLEQHDITMMTAYYVLFQTITKERDPVRVIAIDGEEAYQEYLTQHLRAFIQQQSLTTQQLFLDYVKTQLLVISGSTE